MTKKKTVVSTILFVVFMNLFVKIFSFTRDFLLGRIVGVGFEMDAYVTSLSITTRFFLAFGAAVVTTMIPIIVKDTNEQSKKEKITDIFNFIFVLGLVISIIYYLFTPQIISNYVSGYSAEKIALTVKLTRIMIPSIFFILGANFFVGIMHCNQRYVLATCISIPYNILIVSYIFLASEVSIFILTVVTLLGWFGQMCVLMPSVIKLKSLKIKIRSLNNENTKLFVRSFILIIIVVSTVQVTNITNNKFLSYFDDGVVSMYFYGNMIYNTIVSLIVYGITAVMFPKFNESFVNDKKLFFYYVERVLLIAIIILLPICVGLNLVGDDMMKILFLSDKFPMENVLKTSGFLKTFAFASIGFGFIDILNKAYYSKDNKVTPIVTTLILVISNIVINYIFINILHLNFYFVVVSTVLSYYIAGTYSLLTFKFDNKKKVYKNIIVTFIKASISGFVMYYTVTFTRTALGMNNLNVPTFNNIISLVSSILIGVIVYFVIIIILREEILLETVQKYRKRKNADCN